MKLIPLKNVSDIYKPNDLVEITIEKIRNKNNNQKIPKYLIHVNGDTFGLFSDRYTYCSTKEIIEQFSYYTLENYSYNNGVITAYLQGKQTVNNLPLDENIYKVLMLLSDKTNSELEMFNSKSTHGIFISNSYTGTSKINIGSYIKILFRKNDYYVKLNFIEFNSNHIHTLEQEFEKDLTKFIDFNLDKITKFSISKSRDLVLSKLTKKQKEHFDIVFSQLDQYNTLHLLVFVSVECKENQILTILKELTKIIFQKEENNGK